MDIDELRNAYADDREVALRAVRKQSLVGEDQRLASALVDAGVIEAFARGAQLYKEGTATRGIFFVLCGNVGLSAGGNPIAERGATHQIGSWPVMFGDPRYKVTATALEDTVCLRVEKDAFLGIAAEFSRVWERLAFTQAERLEKTNELFLPTNAIAKVLVASSSEALSNAEEFTNRMQRQSPVEMDFQLWTRVFPYGDSYLDSLMAGLDDWDCAVLLMTPDDVVISKREMRRAPRDNLVFEAGLCMGRLGRKRTLLLEPRHPERLVEERDKLEIRGDIVETNEFKLPSDMAGIKRFSYVESPAEAVPEILEHITRYGARTRLAVHTLDE